MNSTTNFHYIEMGGTSLKIYDGGSSSFWTNTPALSMNTSANDKFTIIRKDGIIKYYRNNNLIYTSTLISNGELYGFFRTTVNHVPAIKVKVNFYPNCLTNSCDITPTCQPSLTSISPTWHFGSKAALQFTSNSVSATASPSSLNTLEGSASISDASGNLLFYTDGSKVYDKMGDMMAGGDLGANNNSTTQSSIIVPKPGSSSSYYLFYNKINQNNGTKTIYYVEVDMSANGGNGAVLSTNSGAICGGSSHEKLTAIRDGEAIWILAIQGAYVCASKITSAGVNVASNYSTSMQNILGNSLNTISNDIGYLKASPDGNKLVFCLPAEGSVVIADFDKATGAVTNPIKIVNQTLPKVYGAEFSPDGSKLYISKYGETSQIYVVNNLGNTPSSPVLFANVGSETVGALQLGPDGNIYVARLNSRYLGRITNANTNPAYQEDAVDLGAERFSKLGLPNFMMGCSN
jgi:hypothetical protein